MNLGTRPNSNSRHTSRYEGLHTISTRTSPTSRQRQRTNFLSRMAKRIRRTVRRHHTSPRQRRSLPTTRTRHMRASNRQMINSIIGIINPRHGSTMAPPAPTFDLNQHRIFIIRTETRSRKLIINIRSKK